MPQSPWGTSWTRASSSKWSRWGAWAGRCGASSRRPASGARRPAAYLRAAGVAVRGRGRPGGREATAKPAISGGGVHRPRAPWPPPGRAPCASACEPYRELIVEALGRGRNAMAIWQDLVDDHGFTARYASVRRFVRQLRGASPPTRAWSSPPPPAKKRRSTTATGRWCAIRRRGKYRRTRLFVLTLGYSRKAVRLLTWQSSAQIWAELHEQAFRRLGGAPRVLVLDNLSEGVLTPDVYDPTLNPLYRDVLAHYGVDRAAVPRPRSRSQGQGRSAASATRSRRRCAGSASRRSSRRRPISIAGRRTGPTRASTARRSGRSR